MKGCCETFKKELMHIYIGTMQLLPHAMQPSYVDPYKSLGESAAATRYPTRRCTVLVQHQTTRITVSKEIVRYFAVKLAGFRGSDVTY